MADEEQRMGRVPIFRGNGKDGLTVEGWCDCVDSAKEIHKYSDKQAAMAACNMLREEANQWKENLQGGTDNEKAAVQAWPDMKKLFIERFGTTHSAGQRVRQIAGLGQRQGESATAFGDRVEGTLRKVTAGRLETQTDNAKAGFVSCRDYICQLLYVAGLKSSTRYAVECHLANDHAMNDIRAHAKQAELAAEGKGGQSVSAISTEGATGGESADASAALKQEIAALKARVNNWSGGKKTGNDGGGGAPGGKMPADMSSRDRWIHCHKCKQWGKHIRRECKASPEDIRAMSAEDSNSRPTGTPFDKQFPNC
jgi:hypothetical protein